MTLSIIPLRPIPNYSFSSKVPVDGVNKTLYFTITYNSIAEYWLLRIQDDKKQDLLSSIPLVSGEGDAINILGQYAYLGIGSAYIVSAETVTEEYPSAATLGSKWVLIWGDTI